MNRIGLIGLCKLELPDGDALLCDGGFIKWSADTYRSKHPVWGTISSIQALSEGIGNQVPALELVMIPASTDVTDFSAPGLQTSRVRFWIGEFNVESPGSLVGSPTPVFDGQIDQCNFTVGRETREVALSIVSNAERLFERNIGNSLNGVFHKSVWAGETGHDNATGLSVPVAWGTEKPAVTGQTYQPGSTSPRQYREAMQ